MLYQFENRKDNIAISMFGGLSPLPHIHPHLEMIYMCKGSSTATLDYRDFLIREGDLFLSFPNQIHCYHDLGPCNGYLMIFSPDMSKEFKDFFLRKIPSSPIVKKEDLPKIIPFLLDKMMHKNNEAPFSKVALRGYLIALLGELLPCMQLLTSTSTPDSTKSILQYCSEHYTEPMSLDILSKKLHLSKYYISHIFKERMNISFPDFINSLRIEYACSLLEKNTNMSDVAFSSGFTSVRTFNRAFSKNMGMSPREYLRQEKR